MLTSKSKMKPRLLLIASLFLFLLCVAACWWFSSRSSGGRLVYVLDDAYIHMAMARNFSEQGVWGVTRHEFTSSSSSLLWTLLLALDYRLFGANDISPLLFNILFGCLVLVIAFFLFRQRALSSTLLFAGLVSLLFLVPLVPLVFTGQEHLLHLALSLFFLHSAARVLSGQDSSYRSLFLTAPLLGMVRYEGLFLIFVVCCFLAAKRRVLPAMILGAAGLFPALIYGFYSRFQGWPFLPNSILLKANVPARSLVLFLGSAMRHWVDAPHMIFLVAAMILALHIQRKRGMISEDVLLMNWIYFAAAVLHMQFAGVNYYYRYEAYLVGLGLFVLLLTVRQWEWPGSKFMVLVFVLLAASLAWRGARSLYHIPHAAKNVYEQQYQMGLFLRNYYQGQTVIANDIGAINYLADIRCLDLMGLGTREVGEMRLRRAFNTEFIRELANSEKASIAIVYDRWFPEGTPLALPGEWKRVARWRITKNVIAGDDTVSFYAVEASQQNALTGNLKSFSKQLPSDVIQLW